MTLQQAGGLHLTPDVFAVVMATGILSVAAGDHRYPHIDGVLAALAALVFVLLCLIGLVRLVTAPAALFRKAREPDVALRLFTFVAACAVLGARFHTHRSATWLLATAATVAWLILVPLAVADVRSRPRADLREHVHGAWLLSSVATAGLAITAADLATHTRWRGWVVLSTAGLVLSLVLYLVTTSLIGRRVVTTPIAANDVTPDTWILMGALAINALAGVRLRGALRSQAVWTWFADAMHPAILVLWVGASAWIPVLLSAEIWRLYRRPDSVHFAGVWWSAVFPLGMYSTATQATAQALHLSVLTTVSLVVFWVGFSVWVLVAAAFVHSTVRAAWGTPRRG